MLDEVGYVPFAQLGAELLFQVISERAERATFVITTNLPDIPHTLSRFQE
ncbi:MAG: ATP-binding protein [Candidatus Competibacteraceae bacterium]|nr:ATP-binding protein [Candidatus Competibacteraceae bacterium]